MRGESSEHGSEHGSEQHRGLCCIRDHLVNLNFMNKHPFYQSIYDFESSLHIFVQEANVYHIFILILDSFYRLMQINIY